MKNYQEENAKTIESWIKNGWEWGKPISHEEYLKAEKGDFQLFLTPTIPMPKEWINGIKGKKVLGLASGGGQQMPLLSALGAECSLIDITKAQIDSDIMVAKRENYKISTVRADITKSLPFPDAFFDFIINPVSLVYCENIEPIFNECKRVLKKDSLFIGGFDNGLNFITDDNEKEIKNHFPFNPLINKDQEKECHDTDAGYEFSHTSGEIIRALLHNGFTILDSYEDYNSEGHFSELRIPTFIAFLAKKN